MTAGRLALLLALAAALVVDALAYIHLPQLRSLIGRHHWIFYLYLGALIALLVAAATLLVTRLVRRPTRS